MIIVIFLLLLLGIIFTIMSAAAKFISLDYREDNIYKNDTDFFEDVVEDLLCIEQDLAGEYGLVGGEKEIHHQLVKMAQAGELDDDSFIVYEWRSAYEDYLGWLNKGSPNVL